MNDEYQQARIKPEDWRAPIDSIFYSYDGHLPQTMYVPTKHHWRRIVTRYCLNYAMVPGHMVQAMVNYLYEPEYLFTVSKYGSERVEGSKSILIQSLSCEIGNDEILDVKNIYKSLNYQYLSIPVTYKLLLTGKLLYFTNNFKINKSFNCLYWSQKGNIKFSYEINKKIVPKSSTDLLENLVNCVNKEKSDKLKVFYELPENMYVYYQRVKHSQFKLGLIKINELNNNIDYEIIERTKCDIFYESNNLIHLLFKCDGMGKNGYDKVWKFLIINIFTCIKNRHPNTKIFFVFTVWFENKSKQYHTVFNNARVPNPISFKIKFRFDRQKILNEIIENSNIKLRRGHSTVIDKIALFFYEERIKDVCAFMECRNKIHLFWLKLNTYEMYYCEIGKILCYVQCPRGHYFPLYPWHHRLHVHIFQFNLHFILSLAHFKSILKSYEKYYE